jgi:hypothetical protein
VRLAASLWLALSTAPVAAQTVAVSPGPASVAVTVYRDPDRDLEDAPDLEWLGGYALITERRTVDIPAGESVLRFEGVAGGILPESAIVTGVPDGVLEKNRDAWLLSPESLLDASLGKRVHIRRTSGATGAVTETDAVIRSGKDGAVVIETPAGIEALRCTGVPETLIYDEVPQGLSARPTLSVRARAAAPVRATLTLSYLASGFDWQADYIAEMSPDGTRVDLFAWLTLANGDETGFRDAETQAVAGRLNREETDGEQTLQADPIRLQCWPQGTTTSDLPVIATRPPSLQGISNDEIRITGSRVRYANLVSSTPITVITAEQEDLGDLKLYRIPEPVTVAAKSQKQVALLRRNGVRGRIVYRADFDVMDPGQEQELPHWFLLARNRAADGLGLPLPGGGVSAFGKANGRPILLGQGTMADYAVGEDVEIDLGEAPQLQTEFRFVCRRPGAGDYELIVANSGPRPAVFEGRLYFREVRSKTRLGKKGADPLWTATVPANSRSVLRFTAPDRKDVSSGEPDEGDCSRRARRR